MLVYQRGTLHNCQCSQLGTHCVQHSILNIFLSSSICSIHLQNRGMVAPSWAACSCNMRVSIQLEKKHSLLTLGTDVFCNNS